MKVIKPDYHVDDTIQTIVGFDSALTGVINAEYSIRLEGDFEGEIRSQGSVFIGQKSKIRGSISALRVIVQGEITGDVDVVESIEIMRTGKLIGDIFGKKLIIDEGAVFKGNVNMDVISPSNIKEA
ncbi:MAG: polymer-forming cytoskeletal protein [Candidatus Margulisbacteria bacterium]|nr:polymer-forming cytoskeletal protein [Candidatus Margulisiibacteriota bacterium]